MSCLPAAAVQKKPHAKRKRNPACGVQKSAPSRAQHLMQIHSKTHSDHGCLQQKSRKNPAIGLIGMDKTEAVNKPEEQGHGWRDYTTGTEEQSHEENSLCIDLHASRRISYWRHFNVGNLKRRVQKSYPSQAPNKPGGRPQFNAAPSRFSNQMGPGRPLLLTLDRKDASVL